MKMTITIERPQSVHYVECEITEDRMNEELDVLWHRTLRPAVAMLIDTIKISDRHD